MGASPETVMLYAIGLVTGAVLLLLVLVTWPQITLYLTGLRIGYALTASEYDLALVARLLEVLREGSPGHGRLTPEQRRIVHRCIDSLEEEPRWASE